MDEHLASAREAQTLFQDPEVEGDEVRSLALPSIACHLVGHPAWVQPLQQANTGDRAEGGRELAEVVLPGHMVPDWTPGLVWVAE